MTEEQMQSSRPLELVRKLIDLNRTSEQNFFTTAEQVDNRAVKLLLKAYAQQQAEFARQLQQTLPSLGDKQRPYSTLGTVSTVEEATADEAVATSGFLHRGWLNLRAALVIRRQHRQRVAIRDLLANETTLLDTYAQNVNQQRANQLADQHLALLLSEQYEQIRATHNQLKLLVEPDARRLVLRLFDQAEPAQQAVQQLQSITAPEEIVTVPITELPVYYNEAQAHPRNQRETIMTGALLGALFGGILGAVYGVFQVLVMPGIGGFFTSTPIGLIGEVALYGAVTGMLFSLIFSLLIARNTEETDTYLYTDSLVQGNTLVAVFTRKDQVAKIERAIGLRREHEIEPMPA